jgi:hypothetical protein
MLFWKPQLAFWSATAWQVSPPTPWRSAPVRCTSTSRATAAVKHQLRRPVLARLLDFEEGRLPLGKETRDVTDRLSAIVADILRRPDLPPQSDIEVASADIIALVKGLIDAAG